MAAGSTSSVSQTSRLHRPTPTASVKDAAGADNTEAGEIKYGNGTCVTDSAHTLTTPTEPFKNVYKRTDISDGKATYQKQTKTPGYILNEGSASISYKGAE